MEQRAPYGREVRIRIGGPAGFGIKAAGADARARLRARRLPHVRPHRVPVAHQGRPQHLPPARQRRRRSSATSCRPTSSSRSTADTIALHLDELTEGGAIVYDPDDVDARRERPRAAETTSASSRCRSTEIVDEVGGIKIMRNVAALGAVLGHMDFPLDGLLDSLRAQFAHKAPEIAEQNVAVATQGLRARAARRTATSPTSSRRSRARRPHVLADGNEAIGLGALAAGSASTRLPDDARLVAAALHGRARREATASSSSTPRTRSRR